MRLEISDLCVEYGPIKAVRGVTMLVEPGELVALVGPNGAGKSSLLHAVCGVASARTGVARLQDLTLTNLSVERISQAGVLLVPERRRIFGRLTVQENLELGSWRVSDASRRAEMLKRAYERFPTLQRLKQRQASLLSGGEQQMLAIGRALAADPTVLLLDEPSLGLAPIIVDQLFETLRELRDDGLTMLLVEQNAARAIALADRTYLMRQGLIVRSGTRDELLRDGDLRSDYLGLAQ